MHRVIVAAVATAMLAFAACGGGGDEPAPPAPTSTPTATVSAATPEASPTATPENLTPAATATAAAPTPTPAIEAVTPITQHTDPTPAGNTPPAPATPTPTPPPAAGNPTSATVGVSGVGRFFWSPGKVTIAPGGSVTWAWSGNDFHDVVVDALGYSSGNPVKAGSYTLTFPNPGTYAANCTIHPDTMRGTITVQ